LMSLLSFAKRIFAGRSGQSSYYMLVDRIGALARSARDLNTFLSGVADEFGRELDLTRSIILFRTENGIKRAGEFTAQAINSTTRERLRNLDFEIAREFAARSDLVATTIEEADPALKAIF